MALKTYLRDVVNIEHYQIVEEEFGVIPMKQLHLEENATDTQNIIRIGTPGGALKPSTGYAFARIQEQTQQIARQISQGLQPSSQLQRPERFTFYDRLLLSILHRHGELGAGIFGRLFRGVSFHTILKFLDESTSLREEISIVGSLPVLPFFRALWQAQRIERNSVVSPATKFSK